MTILIYLLVWGLTAFVEKGAKGLRKYVSLASAFKDAVPVDCLVQGAFPNPGLKDKYFASRLDEMIRLAFSVCLFGAGVATEIFGYVRWNELGSSALILLFAVLGALDLLAAMAVFFAWKRWNWQRFNLTFVSLAYRKAFDTVGTTTGMSYKGRPEEFVGKSELFNETKANDMAWRYALTGSIGNRAFSFGNLSLTQKTENVGGSPTYAHRFKGTVLAFELPKPVSRPVIVTNDPDLTKPEWVTVRTGNLKFDANYRVYAKDEGSAKGVLTDAVLDGLAGIEFSGTMTLILKGKAAFLLRKKDAIGNLKPDVRVKYGKALVAPMSQIEPAVTLLSLF